MASSTQHQAGQTKPGPTGEHADDEGVSRPRIIEEHQVVGPRGEEEIDATDELGRRWYRLRPDPRRRVDMLGFNYIWWFALWMLVLLIILPWGNNWGW